jgi:hypothetical protein
MKKNIILSISVVFMQIARILIAIIASLQVVIFVGALIKNTPISEIIIQNGDLLINQNGLSIFELTRNSPWLSFLIILQNIGVLMVVFTILGYCINIVRNIHSVKTFTIDNVNAFHKISQLSIILILIKLIKLSPDKIGLGIDFSYIFLAFGAIILTQVFKEGHRLLQENELTV